MKQAIAYLQPAESVEIINPPHTTQKTYLSLFRNSSLIQDFRSKSDTWIINTRKWLIILRI